MPTVSVLIPSHNRASFLEEAIESVLAQDFEDFELIVIDDGSTDNTQELLRSYPRVCVVTQGHRGVSSARNVGIARATGRFIAFLDSDDLWMAQKLTAQIALFRNHPNALVCQTEEIWMRNGRRVNPKMRHSKPSGMIFERSLELCLVSPSAVMMRRGLFDEVGWFDETLPACEDYDLWLRIACRFPIYLIERPLVIKRGGHEDQLSRQPGLDRFRIHALVKILENPPRGGLTFMQRKAALETLSSKCSIYAAGCLKRGRVEEAEEYLALSARFENPDQRAAESQVDASGQRECDPEPGRSL